MENVTTKTKTGRRASINTGPFAAAYEDFRNAEIRTEELSRAHSAAEEAAQAFDRHEVAPPAALTIHHEPMTLIRGNRVIPTEPWSFTYKSLRSVEESSELSAAQKAELSEALAGWQREQDEADERSGYNRIERAVEAAHRRWMAQHRRTEKAALAVLRIPTSDAREIALKWKIIRDYFEGGNEEAVTALLQAAKAQPPEPPPPAQGLGFGAALEAFHAARRFANEGELPNDNLDAAVDQMDRAFLALVQSSPVTAQDRADLRKAVFDWCDQDEPGLMEQALNALTVGELAPAYAPDWGALVAVADAFPEARELIEALAAEGTRLGAPARPAVERLAELLSETDAVLGANAVAARWQEARSQYGPPPSHSTPHLQFAAE